MITHKGKLPQWILSSDYAAYHPFKNTIHILEDESMLTLIHEYAHWWFHGIGFDVGHKIIDSWLFNLPLRLSRRMRKK